jgi:hypothetical protein
VAYIDSEASIYNTRKAQWEKLNTVRIDTDSMIFTSGNSRRNIFRIGESGSIRADKNTYFSVKKLKTAFGSKEIWLVKISFGCIWFDINNNNVKIETPQGIITCETGAIQVNIEKNNDVKIIVCKNNASFKSNAPEENEIKNIPEGQILTVISEDPNDRESKGTKSYSMVETPEEKTSWQFWNESCKFEDILIGKIAKFEETKKSKPKENLYQDSSSITNFSPFAIPASPSPTPSATPDEDEELKRKIEINRKNWDNKNIPPPPEFKFQ